MSFHILFLDYKTSLKLILLDDTEKKNWFVSIFFFQNNERKEQGDVLSNCKKNF